MATKDELKDDILALDPNATVTADATHDDLTAQLREIKATRAELDELAESQEAEKVLSLSKRKAPEYRVPKGKAMTTGAGIKSEGQEVTADMVVGGESKLQLLKSKGLLI